MRNIVFVWTCLACAGQAHLELASTGASTAPTEVVDAITICRRAAQARRSKGRLSSDELSNPLRALTILLSTIHPTAAFNPSGLGLHVPMLSSRQAALGRVAPLMQEAPAVVDSGSVAFVLLAGGSGKRMGANMPKQYLPLKGREIALWSLDIISALDEVGEVVVVCAPEYQDIFTGAVEKGWTHGKRLLFASPGKERMDSVENGVNAVENGKLLCIHDSARPLVRAEDVRRCFQDAATHGAAVLGVPCKATVKQALPIGEDGVVKVAQTLDRSTLWEMHTPQVIEPSLLKRGYEHVRNVGAEVTDDVSIVEAIGEPVIITEDSYENLKITTPEDLVAAEGILDGRIE